MVKTRQRTDELRVQVDLRGEMDVKLQQTFQADLPENRCQKPSEKASRAYFVLKPGRNTAETFAR